MTTVSYAKNVRQSDWGGTDLASILKEIKSNKHKSLVTKIRQGGGNKLALPAFCPSELTGGRRIGANVKGASCIVLDLDGIQGDPGSTSEAEYVRDDLLAAMEDGSGQIDRVHAMFVSPSGNGLKLVYRLDRQITTPQDFTYLYKRLSSDLVDNYGELLNGGKVDTSASDITRATFLSHDPNIHVNGSVWPLDIKSMLRGRNELKPVSIVSSDFLAPGERSDHLKERILFAANNLKAPHYKDFRNLCNAASSFGDREFLGVFAQYIRPNSFTESGPKTAQRIDANWDKYLDSFFSVFGTPRQIPIDYIIRAAQAQGIKVELDSKMAHSDTSFFNPEESDEQIVKIMDERYRVICRGKDTEIVQFYDGKHRKHHRIANKRAVSDETRKHCVYRIRGDGKKQKKIKYYDIWFDETHRYDGVDFVPGAAATTSQNMLNLWDGFELDHEISAGVVQEENNLELWTKFIGNLFEGTDDQKERQTKYMLDWMANLVQNPGKKTGVSVTLLGGQGTGKTFLGTVIEALTNPYNTRINNSSIITSQYTSYLEGVVFLFVDEATVATDKATKSKLKALVTDDNILIDKKFQTAYTVKNYTNLMFASNESWTANVDTDDRRHQIFNVSDIFKQNSSFFAALHSELYEEGGLMVLFNQLKARDISGMNFARDRVMLDANTSQSAMSLQNVAAWLYDIYTLDGEFLHPNKQSTHGDARRDFLRQTLDEEGQSVVLLDALYNGYNHVAKENSNKQIRSYSTKATFSKALNAAYRDLGFDGLVARITDRQTTGERLRVVNMPSINEGLRALVEKNLAEPELLAEEKEEKTTHPEEKTLTPPRGELLYKEEGETTQLWMGDEMDVPY